ncbi:hypothetical protein QUC31_017734, partial [Theobroma cacao]
RFWRHGNLV